MTYHIQLFAIFLIIWIALYGAFRILAMGLGL